MMLSYFALLRDVTRKANEEWTRPAATLGDLLRDLVAAYGPPFGRWVMVDGGQFGPAVVLVDGQDARGLQGLETPLKPDSDIVIFPPLAAG
jgi:molybdopterin synthase sulfur carrier subunit